MITRIADHVLVARWRLSGFRSSHVPTRHGRVHVLDALGTGSGPPIVVLHGLAAAAHHYGNLLTALRPLSRRVIGIDLPGHGHSDLPSAHELHLAMEDALVRAFEETVGHEGAIVVGNSLGGAAAVRLARRRPDLVRGLYLVAPGGAAMDDRELSEFLSRFALRTHGEALRFVDDLFHQPHRFRHALAWGTRQQFRRSRVRAVVRSFRRESMLGPADLSGLAMPVEVLWGGADRVLTPGHLRFWRAHLPRHARLEVHEQVGHVPHIDTLDLLVAGIEGFTRRIAAEPAVRPDSPAVPAA